MGWREDIERDYGLSETGLQSLERLLDLLLAQDDRNLSGVTRAEDVIRVHFLDSLWLLRMPELREAAKVADIGSGAGFPGLPLAIARPGLEVTLIEASRKKSEFIGLAVGELNLPNAEVLNQRAEEVARSRLRESFDVSLARAVGPLAEVLEYSLPLLRKGGAALLQRGAREPGDEKLADFVASKLGGRLERIEKARPYPEAKNLHVWVFSKTGATPARFPRRPGMARKRPLGPGS